MSILHRLTDVIPKDQALEYQILGTASLFDLSSDLIEDLGDKDDGCSVRSLRAVSIKLTRTMEKIGITDGRDPSSEMSNFMDEIRRRLTALMNGESSGIDLGLECWNEAFLRLGEINQLSVEAVSESTRHCMGVLRTACGLFLEVSEVE